MFLLGVKLFKYYSILPGISRSKLNFPHPALYTRHLLSKLATILMKIYHTSLALLIFNDFRILYSNFIFFCYWYYWKYIGQFFEEEKKPQCKYIVRTIQRKFAVSFDHHNVLHNSINFTCMLRTLCSCSCKLTRWNQFWLISITLPVGYFKMQISSLNLASLPSYRFWNY